MLLLVIFLAFCATIKCVVAFTTSDRINASPSTKITINDINNIVPKCLICLPGCYSLKEAIFYFKNSLLYRKVTALIKNKDLYTSFLDYNQGAIFFCLFF